MPGFTRDPAACRMAPTKSGVILFRLRSLSLFSEDFARAQAELLGYNEAIVSFLRITST